MDGGRGTERVGEGYSMRVGSVFRWNLFRWWG